MNYRGWLVLWSLWAARLVRQPTPELRVSSGRLRGAAAPDGSHAYYIGIPYATVERFQAPGPEPKWEGVFEATDEHIFCPQRMAGAAVLGHEQCLILNVYVPLNTPSAAKLPVMVFIHGGGFFAGSSRRLLYGPEHLVSKGVILVTVNYRLNIQGFLCLRTKDAPGNAGLKDQVAALKWVQRNIAAFGGDPDNVTIFGESAGGSSVSLHVVSPMSKGLFHKAITQSGSSLGSWSMQHEPLLNAHLLAKALNFDAAEPKELYDIFMNTTDDVLVRTRVPREKGNIILSEILFVPCVEQELDGVEAFLTEEPYKLYQKGEFNKVPMVLGANSEEGYFFAAFENDTVLPDIDFRKALPKDLALPERARDEVADTMKRIYLGDEEISMKNILRLSRYHGEVFFVYPSLEETELLLRNSNEPVYNYYFAYGGWRNLAKWVSGAPFSRAPGAAHADDLFYLFQPCAVPSLLENKMIDTMTTLWTNFAKYGDPTPAGVEGGGVPRWAPTSRARPAALVLAEELSSQPLWYNQPLQQLRTIYDKYRRTSL